MNKLPYTNYVSLSDIDTVVTIKIFYDIETKSNPYYVIKPVEKGPYSIERIITKEEFENEYIPCVNLFSEIKKALYQNTSELKSKYIKQTDETHKFLILEFIDDVIVSIPLLPKTDDELLEEITFIIDCIFESQDDILKKVEIARSLTYNALEYIYDCYNKEKNDNIDMDYKLENIIIFIIKTLIDNDIFINGIHYSQTDKILLIHVDPEINKKQKVSDIHFKDIPYITRKTICLNSIEDLYKEKEFNDKHVKNNEICKLSDYTIQYEKSKKIIRIISNIDYHMVKILYINDFKLNKNFPIINMNDIWNYSS